MDDVYDDPLHGPLTLERSMNATGYKEVNKKVDGGGRIEYYVKLRLDLNEKSQTTLAGSFKSTAREAAIFRATYLKEHPPVPKRAGGKASAHTRTHRPPALDA